MADINRRQFLAASGATGLFAAFPSIARAVSIPANVKSGSIKDVEHVVILMQENRSFDHYFGTLSGVRGFSDPYPAPAKATEKQQNRDVFLQQNTTKEGPEWVHPFPLNTRQNFAHMRVEGTPHSWPDAQDAWDHGRMSHWPDAKYLHAMGYFNRDDMPFQFALAEAFTLCDAYYCSSQTGTNTNRLFLWSGTNDGNATHGGPAIGNSHDNLPENGGYAEAYSWTTYVERLQDAGIDWTIYQDMADNFTDNPLVGFKAFQDSYAGTPDSDPELATRALTTRALDKLRDDAANGTSLPQRKARSIPVRQVRRRVRHILLMYWMRSPRIPMCGRKPPCLSCSMKTTAFLITCRRQRRHQRPLTERLPVIHRLLRTVNTTSMSPKQIKAWSDPI